MLSAARVECARGARGSAGSAHNFSRNRRSSARKQSVNIDTSHMSWHVSAISLASWYNRPVFCESRATKSSAAECLNPSRSSVAENLTRSDQQRPMTGAKRPCEGWGCVALRCLTNFKPVVLQHAYTSPSSLASSGFRVYRPTTLQHLFPRPALAFRICSPTVWTCPVAYRGLRRRRSSAQAFAVKGMFIPYSVPTRMYVAQSRISNFRSCNMVSDSRPQRWTH